jgi:hypothetical protein
VAGDRQEQDGALVDTATAGGQASREAGAAPSARGPSRPDRPGLDPARIGRRAAWGVYWALAIFVCVAGLRSAIPQIFWPEAGVPQVAGECGPALEGLAGELEALGAARPQALRRERLAEWDRHYLALHDGCHGQPAYDALYRARYAVENHADRTDDDVAPLLDEARAALRSPGD